MERIKRILVVVAFMFAGFSSAFADEIGYVRMPILIFDTAKSEYIKYEDVEKERILKQEAFVIDNKQTIEELTSQYTKNNDLNIKVVKVKMTKDKRYAIVYAYLRAYFPDWLINKELASLN